MAQGDACVGEVDGRLAVDSLPVSGASTYLDEPQRQMLSSFRRSLTWRTEWPTWLLLGAVYGAWFGIAIHARNLGLPVTASLLAVVSAWYLSLQHELIHGHPTRSAWINALLGFAPLAVWFPYEIYRRSHLAHHTAVELTHPQHDPESLFVSAATWQRANQLMRTLIVVRTTFLGHVLLGPASSLVSTAQDSWRKIAKGDLAEASIWIVHWLALAKLAAWLEATCGIPVPLFIGGVGYPALCIASIRSFREHRYHRDPACRTVVNHAALPWRLLFLNNNFHAVHHHLPGVPWYALGIVYRSHAADYQRRNGGYVVYGYRQWLWQFATKPRATVVHPST